VTGIRASSLYHLADALGMTLRLSGDPKVVVRGETVRSCTNHKRPSAPAIKVPLRVVSSFVSLDGGEVGLLCRSSGFLYLYAVNGRGRETVEVRVVDGSVFKHRPDGLFEERRVRDHERVMRLMADSFCAAYTKEHGSVQWKDTSAPSP